MADMRERYESLHLADLKAIAKTRGMKGLSTAKKAVIIEALLTKDALEAEETGKVEEAEKPAAVEEINTNEAAEVSDKDQRRRYQNPYQNQNRFLNHFNEEEEEEQAPSPYTNQNNYQSRSRQQNTRQQEDRPRQDYRQQEDRSRQENRSFDDEQGEVTGIFEPVPENGYGFLRSDNFMSGDNDVYVSNTQIRRFDLRVGDMVTGKKQRNRGENKNAALMKITEINGVPVDKYKRRPKFEDLTPIFPDERLSLDRPGSETATRIVDLISPIGKGQRGMIVSPPKAGKTTLLKDIAKSILRNYPDMHMIILLIDERPEEVTDMKESIIGDQVEVIYSTFDQTPQHHIKVSEMVIERARRLTEQKEDVIILLDSITRLARAYNLTVNPSGRTLSGGLDPAALHDPKKFFGAARNVREGGSLTILATALVDTGSKLDDMVFEEFKGTGNMELVLDRKLQERRIFPAIDIDKSGTRRDDLLLSKDEQNALTVIHRNLDGRYHDEYLENLLKYFRYEKTTAGVVKQVLKK